MGSDARRKEARLAKAEQARLQQNQEEVEEKWNDHHDVMTEIEESARDLTDEIKACQKVTLSMQDNLLLTPP